MEKETLHGKCLCGSVQFEISGETSPLISCHCGQCRQWGGHAWASLGTSTKHLSFTQGEEKVKWYESSSFARRGFCSDCGSSLFWHADRHEEYKTHIAVSAGSIDNLGDSKLTKHIFCKDKGAYYDIADGLPQLETF